LLILMHRRLVVTVDRHACDDDDDWRLDDLPPPIKVDSSRSSSAPQTGRHA
jgi:hypothetical protein